MTIIDKIESVAFVIIMLVVVLGLIVWRGLYVEPQSNRKRLNKRKGDSDDGDGGTVVKMDSLKKVIFYIISIFYFAIAPAACVIFDGRLNTPYPYPISDMVFLFVIVGIGLGMLAFLFLKKGPNSPVIQKVDPLIYLIVLASISIGPWFLISTWENYYDKKLNAEILHSLRSTIPDNILDTEPTDNESYNLAPTSKVLLYDLDRGSLLIDNSKELFNRNLKYPSSIEDLDYVIVLKVKRELEVDKEYRIHWEIGLLKWKENRLLTKNLFNVEVSESTYFNEIDRDQSFGLYKNEIRYWIYKELLPGVDKPDWMTYLEGVIYGLPLILLAIFYVLFGD
jgi:hypothetical protein